VNVPREGLLRPAHAWGQPHLAVGASLLQAVGEAKGSVAKSLGVAAVVGGFAGIEVVRVVAVRVRRRRGRAEIGSRGLRRRRCGRLRASRRC
jgi:hypothetical protein